MPQYDWRDLATAAHQPIEPEPEEIVLRHVMRLHAQCRTPEDIGTLTGMNPIDVRVLIYGRDEPGDRMTMMCTKQEAARRRSRLFALIAFALPEVELVKFMTSPKPPSEADLVRYVKRTAEKNLRCVHCGGSLLDVEPSRDGENTEKLPAGVKPK